MYFHALAPLSCGDPVTSSKVNLEECRWCGLGKCVLRCRLYQAQDQARQLHRAISGPWSKEALGDI